MLTEHTGRLGNESDPFICRRVFSDSYFWLTVDLDDDRQIETFHLTYEFGTTNMRCYRWRRDQGLRHYRVDDGGDIPFHNASPLLITEEEASGDVIMEKFKEASLQIDMPLAVFVIRKLKENAVMV